MNEIESVTLGQQTGKGRRVVVKDVAGREPVVIVSGLPRSGTSMMMQLLEAGGLPVLTDRIREADVDNPRGYYEFERVKEVARDTSWLVDASGKVVKMVYRLLYDLPAEYSYRVIFMQRDLAEVLASQDEMLRRLGKASGEPSDDQLAQLYRRQLDDVMGWLEDQTNFQAHYVRYQYVLDEPDGVIAEINDFLGGRLDTAAMRRVPDRSLYRQRRS